VLSHHQNDTRQFAPGKPAAVLQADWVQPDLGAIGVALDVHVGWLGAVAREEEAPVWPDTQNGRHGE